MRIMKKLLVTTAALAVLTTHASATVALEYIIERGIRSLQEHRRSEHCLRYARRLV